jgi:hypothetical protein
VLRVAGRLDRLFEDLGAPDVGSALAQFYGKSLRAVGEHTGGVFAITARARKR